MRSQQFKEKNMQVQISVTSASELQLDSTQNIITLE